MDDHNNQFQWITPGFTNEAFEYSKNLGTEETDYDNLASVDLVRFVRFFCEKIIKNVIPQEESNNKMARGIVERVIEHDRTLEFNNSKESTMIWY